MENKNMLSLLLVLSLSLVLLGLSAAHGHAHTGDGPRMYTHPTLSEAVALQLSLACRKTSYPDLCAHTISSYLDSNAATNLDISVFFQASLKAAIEEVKEGLRIIENKLAIERDSFYIDCLKGCKDYYNTAISKIEEALTKTNYNELTSGLSSAISQISSCGDDFDPRLNIMEDVNTRTGEVIDNALAFAGFTKW